MANDFKRFTATSITSGTTGASADAVYTVPAGGGSTALETVVIGILLSNKSSGAITASVFLDDYAGSADAYLIKDAPIPAGSSLEILSGNKVVLQNNGSAGDALRVETNTAAACDAVISVLEDV